jgi:hypothetical protein
MVVVMDSWSLVSLGMIVHKKYMYFLSKKIISKNNYYE